MSIFDIAARPPLIGAVPQSSSINVSLTPELVAWIAAQVASGRYRSASEVVRQALRQLQGEEARGIPGALPNATPETLVVRTGAAR